MSRVASAAASMGVDVDQLNAQLSTIISVTRQAPESVGTALRSIYARMGQLKVEGQDEFGVSLGKYTEDMKKMGIEILDQEGNMREMGVVIEEVADKWQYWTQAQRNAAAQAMAGTRQYNNLIALFDNWDKYTAALETSQNAMGTLQKQQDTYMESTQAHLQQMRTAFEGVADSLLDTSTVNNFADIITFIYNKFEDFVDIAGGGGNLLIGVFGSLAQIFNKQITSGIMSFVNNMQIAKENAEKLQTSLANINFIRGSEAYQKDAGVQQIVDMTGAMTKYYSVMSEGQINTANSLAKQAADAKVLELQWKENTEQALAFAKAIAHGKGNKYTTNSLIADSKGYYRIQEDLSRVSSLLTDVQKGTEKVSTAFAGIDRKASVDTLNKQFETLAGAVKSTSALINKADLNKEAGAVKEFNQELAQVGITAGQVGKMTTEELINVFKTKWNADSRTDFVTTLTARIRQVSEVAGTEINNLSQILNMSEEQLNSYSVKFKNALAEYLRYLESMGNQARVTSIVRLTGAMSQLSFTINGMVGLIKIWGDESLSAGEKWTKTISQVLMLLPGIVQMSLSLKQSTAMLNLFSISKIGEASATAAATTGEAAHAAALGVVTREANKSMISIKLLNREIMFNPFAAAVAGVLALVTALAALTSAYEKANQAAIENDNKTIEEENKKQEEIESNRELWESLEELNKKYQDGDMTRSELKESIEDLIKQYGLEKGAADELRGSYDNLTESIRKSRIEAAQERLDSIKREKENAEDAALRTAKGSLTDSQQVSGDRYSMGLKGGGLFGNLKDEPEWLIKALKDAGGTQAWLPSGEDTTLHFNVDYDIDSLLELYDVLNDVYEEAQDQLTVQEQNDSEFFKNLGKWLSEKKESFEEYRQVREEEKSAEAEMAGLQGEQEGLFNFEKNSIDSLFNYIVEKNKMIFSLRDKGIELVEASNLTNEYLLKNHEDLYNKYDELYTLIDNTASKAGSMIYSTETDLIDTFNEAQLNTLLRINPDDIQSWEDLKLILTDISEMNFDNIGGLFSSGDVDDLQSVATSIYNVYQDAEDKVSKNQKLTKKEYEDLPEMAQEYFLITSNGQYKMIKDAEAFYAAFDGFKVQGFVQLLDELKERINSLNELQTRDFDYSKLSQEGVIESKTTTDEEGNETILPDMVNYDLVDQQLEYLSAVTDTNSELAVSIDLWRQQVAEQRITVDEAREIAKAVNEIGDQTENATEKTEALKDEYEETFKQLQEAAKGPLDEDIDTDTYENLTDILLAAKNGVDELGKALADDLDENAAENVAEAILRFDDAIVDNTEHYEDWAKALESGAVQDQADLVDELSDAYGDLLDVDPSVFSDGFLKSKENLDLMQDAIKGNEAAYDQLMAKLQKDIDVDAHINTEDFNAGVNDLLNQYYNVDSLDDLEVGASLNDQGFLDGLTNMVKTAELARDEATARLASMGIDAEVIEADSSTTETNEYPDSTLTLTPVEETGEVPAIVGSGEEIKGSPQPLTFRGYSFDYDSTPVTSETEKENKAFGVKVISANKSSGGNFKFSQAKHGGGSGGGGGKGKGGGGRGGGGGGSKAKTPNKVKPKLQRADRYYKVNNELSKLNTSFEKLANTEEKLFGNKLLNNLNKQLKNLKSQVQTLKEKQKLQRQELKEVRTGQTKNGQEVGPNLNKIFKFNKNGDILDYTKWFNQQNKKLYDMQKHYNTLSADAQEAYQKKIDEQEDYMNDVQDAVDRYTELKYESIPELAAEIRDIMDQQVELQIAKFNYKIEVRMDWSEALRDYNEFKEKVDKDYFEPKDKNGKPLYEDKEGTIANAKRLYADYKSYFNDKANGGIIQDETEHLNKVRKEINKINKGKKSSIFGTDKDAALEELKASSERLMEYLENLRDIEEEVHDDYMDMIDQASEAFDTQVDTYEYIDDMLEHDMNVMELLYGEEAYAQMASYYQQRKENNNQELDFLRKRAEFANEMYQKETDLEAKEEWKKQWLDALQDVNDKFEEQLELILDEYKNSVELAFQELNNQLSHGLGLDFLQDEWDLMEKEAEQWLDPVNALYGLNQLQNKYQEAMDNTDNVHNQKVLNDLMESELEMLREKDHLSQYDLDRANKKYEIALKQLEAENAEQNKSKLRLRRDSQGNYSYQFVEDEEQVEKLRDELATLKNELYNLDLEKYKDNLETIYEYNKEYQEKLKELELEKQQALQEIENNSDLSEAERFQKRQEVLENVQEKERILKERYEGIFNKLLEDNLTVRYNLQDSAIDSLESGPYKDNEIAFENMTGHNIEEFKNADEAMKNHLMTILVPAWTSGLQSMTDEITKAGGLKQTYEETFEKLEDATKKYQESIKTTAEIAGKDLQDLSMGYDANEKKVESLVEDNGNLIEKYKQEIKAIEDVMLKLDALIKKYEAAEAAALKAVNAALKLQKQETEKLFPLETQEESKKNLDEKNLSNLKDVLGRYNESPDVVKQEPNVVNDKIKRTEKQKYGVAIAIWNGGYGWNQNRTSKLIEKGFNPSEITSIMAKVDPDSRSGGWENKYHGINSKNLKNYAYNKFKTGGYTGEWGEEGKLAVLHEKELILNKADTKNILNAVNLVRDMGGLLESLSQSMNGRIAGLMGSLQAQSSLYDKNNAIEQTVHITAEFPNVRDSRDIEEALNNLVNSASQYAFRSRP